MRTATTVNASRRRRRPSKKKATRKAARKAPVARKKRRAHKAAAVKTRSRRRVKRVEAKRSRRRRASHVMEASKRRRPKRRRVVRAVEAWKGDSAGHAKAARKGHRQRKARKAGRQRSKRVRETSTVSASKRRRHVRRTREPVVAEAKRSRRRYHARASKRSSGMGPGEIALMIGMGGLGFVLSDGLDRLLATYDPAGPGDKPKDKFTSDGAGTLANTLNIAAMPGWQRLVAGVGVTAVPVVGAMYVKNPIARAGLEGLAVGAGINLFKTLWNNVLMPILVGKDTSTPALQKSYVARLYPAEVAAHINLAALKGADGKMPTGPFNSNGVLSDEPGALGAPADVGPFALGGDSPYPTAEQVLRAGVSGDSPYPSAADALRAGVSGDSPYPTAAAALRKQAGVAWQPGPASTVGPGPQAEPGKDPSCGCIGESNPFLGFVGDAPAETPAN